MGGIDAWLHEKRVRRLMEEQEKTAVEEKCRSLYEVYAQEGEDGLLVAITNSIQVKDMLLAFLRCGKLAPSQQEKLFDILSGETK